VSSNRENANFGDALSHLAPELMRRPMRIFDNPVMLLYCPPEGVRQIKGSRMIAIALRMCPYPDGHAR
jgi:hypothetical protein